MIEPAAAGPRTPPWRVLLLAALVLAVAAWFMMRSFTSQGSRECRALYRAARTAADTAQADSTHTPGRLEQVDPPSCGMIRSSARWR